MLPPAKPTVRFFASLLKYLTAAIFIFIPLYPKFPLFFLPGSAVAIRAEDFLIFVTSIVLATHLFLTKKTKLPPLAFQVAVYLAVGALSVLSAIFITKNINPLLAIFHWGRRLEYMLVFFFAYYVGKQGEGARKLLFELILLVPIGVFLYGIAQIFAAAPVISTMNKESAKGIALTLQPGVQLSSTFAGHYDLAIYLAMILAYFATLLTLNQKRSSWFGLLAGFVLLLWLFTQAGSRIAIFGLVFSVALVCFLRRKIKLAILLTALLCASIFTSPSLMMRLGNLLRIWEAQVQSALTVPQAYAADVFGLKVLGDQALRPIQQDRSTSIRFDVEWPRALRSLYKNPFLGTGYSSISLATDNEYLRALGETGVLGFFAFMAILIALFRVLVACYRLAKTGLDQAITLGALGVYSVFLISALFLDVFEASKIAIMFWAFTGLAVSTKS